MESIVTVTNDDLSIRSVVDLIDRETIKFEYDYEEQTGYCYFEDDSNAHQFFENLYDIVATVDYLESLYNCTK